MTWFQTCIWRASGLPLIAPWAPRWPTFLGFLALGGCLEVPSAVDRRPPDEPIAAGRCGQLNSPGDFARTLTSDGRERAFYVHVPIAYDGRPTPLVFDFHGAGLSAEVERDLTHMITSADERTLLVVHPQGLYTGWNAGLCCGAPTNSDVDDVQFVRDMIAALSVDYCVDPRRIFATGFSNGGFLAHRLACELGDRIAAVASVSGVMGVPCQPSRPIAVLDIHGTADASIPYGGTAVLPSVGATMTEWAARDGCAASPHETSRIGAARCQSWAPCAADVDVALCSLDGAGHRWPAGDPDVAAGGGVKTTDLDATWTILEFFAKHPGP